MTPQCRPEVGTIVANPPDSRIFHTLDALRGIAAIGVVIYHLQGAFLPFATPGGYLAVDLFFMMSGVVLSHAYESRFRAGMGALDFMRARWIRLYPLYLLGALFGIAVTLGSLAGRNINGWDAHGLLRAAVQALLLIPDFYSPSTAPLFPLNIPSWSLFFEILINVVFVLAWPLLTSPCLVVVSLLAGAAVCIASVQQGGLDQGSIAATFLGGWLRTVFGFSVGVLIARYAGHLPRRVSNPMVLTTMAAVLVAIAGWPTGGARIVWDALCVLLLFPLLVYTGTVFDPGPRLRKVGTFLGVTSYAVYVLHSPFASVLGSARRHFLGDGTSGAPYLGIAALGVLLAGAWLIDRFYDIPVRRKLSRMVMRSRPVRAST
jgi:peptidoglycan/LPS O-acetylase OafA/YrhL